MSKYRIFLFLTIVILVGGNVSGLSSSSSSSGSGGSAITKVTHGIMDAFRGCNAPNQRWDVGAHQLSAESCTEIDLPNDMLPPAAPTGLRVQ